MRNNARINRDKYNARSYAKYHREKILDYFNNKCGECGSLENLEIHHLDYKWDKVEFESKLNIGLNIDKCEVLCMKCHRKRHNSA